MRRPVVRTYVRAHGTVVRFTDERLSGLYTGDGFGGETTARARVIRDLIDELSEIRRELDHLRDAAEALGVRLD